MIRFHAIEPSYVSTHYNVVRYTVGKNDQNLTGDYPLPERDAQVHAESLNQNDSDDIAKYGKVQN